MSVAPIPLTVTERELRRFQVAAGRRILLRNGCDNWVGGHVTIRAEDEDDSYWVTNWDYADQTFPESIWKLRLDDSVIERGAGRVSGAIGFHGGVYRARPDVQAIVHTHSEYATLFSMCDEPLGLYCLEAAPFHHQLPRYEWLTKADDEPFGRALGKSNALLMPHHGIITVADRVETAVVLAIMLEHACKTHLQAKLYGGKEIDAKDFNLNQAALAREIWRNNIARLARSDPEFIAAVRPEVIAAA